MKACNANRKSFGGRNAANGNLSSLRDRKKVRKAGCLITALCAALLALATPVTSLAQGWQQDSSGWWYGTNADNTQWHAGSWQWIDGNGDGAAECYYFDQNGYVLINTTTPDGCQVNADGAWTVNGVVQTKTAAKAGNEQNQEALAAYRKALTESDDFQSHSTSGEKASFCLFDANNDGISEMYAYIPGQGNYDTNAWFCWYANSQLQKVWVQIGKLYCHPETGDLMSDYYHMGCSATYLHFDGTSTVQTADEFFEWDYNDDCTEMVAASAADQEVMDRHDQFAKTSISLSLIEFSKENLDQYFGSTEESSRQLAAAQSTSLYSLKTDWQELIGMTSGQLFERFGDPEFDFYDANQNMRRLQFSSERDTMQATYLLSASDSRCYGIWGSSKGAGYIWNLPDGLIDADTFLKQVGASNVKKSYQSEGDFGYYYWTFEANGYLFYVSEDMEHAEEGKISAESYVDIYKKDGPFAALWTELR